MFLRISTNFTSTHAIPSSPQYLKSSRIQCSPQVKPRTFTSNVLNRLRSLYAQLFRTTLAPFVLPRLLARSLPPLIPLVPSLSSQRKEVYTNKGFILHAVSLHQAFAHCGRFLTAASRRSMDRVSVPLWLFVLSDQLPVIALVGFYPAN